MNRFALASIAALMVAVPTLSGCSSSSASSPCSSANQRQFQQDISRVESLANLTSLDAVGPSCDYSNGSKNVTAQRTYSFTGPVSKALESAFSKDGWASIPATGGDVYDAHVKKGALTNRVELVEADDDVAHDGRYGSVLQARFELS